MRSAADGSPVVRAGGGETIFDRPERTIRILADRDELTLTWFRLEAGVNGPDPHIHERHTDAFYVLAGELEVGLGPDAERLTAAPGALVAAPPKVVHTFRNASGSTTLFLNVHAPSMRFGEMLPAARDGRNTVAAQDGEADVQVRKTPRISGAPSDRQLDGTPRFSGEAEIREGTGVTVIAIVREPHSVAASEPTDRLERGDVLVTVGRLDDYESFRNLVSHGEADERT